MVFTTYREFLKNFKPSEPKNLFAEGGPAWNKYKKEHAAEIEKAPKKPLSKTRKKGKKSKGTKKIRHTCHLYCQKCTKVRFDL